MTTGVYMVGNCLQVFRLKCKCWGEGMADAIYLDCFSGISGMRFLGALVDAGVPVSYLMSELKKIGGSDFELKDNVVYVNGIRATELRLKIGHEHRVFESIEDTCEIIDRSKIVESARNKAITALLRMAKAETKLTGCSAKQRHTECDSLNQAFIKVLGTMIGLDYLGVETVISSALHVGSGFSKCGGTIKPIPSPITAELLVGYPFFSTHVEGELVTCVGAALVTSIANSFGPIPSNFLTHSVAYGASGNASGEMNFLRLYSGKIETAKSGQESHIIETNIDDQNPQIYGYLMEKLFLLGVNDLYLIPIIMKKGRPGTKISVTAHGSKVREVINTILKETTSLGVKVYPCEAFHAEREIRTVDTRWGAVRMKIGYLDGEIINIAPEYEDCKRIAETYNVALKHVFAESIYLTREFKQSNL